mmetsp:Transcript_34960/g.47170  ORF Transcript_34960/g.47170 Transcript_34960/m.47170 type:complete len:202 (-) Transcript_34960:290-895(-)
MAFSFWTRFTVVGIRTPSATCLRFSASSDAPLINQSRAACVSFPCFRRAFRAGPSSKPCDSNEESDSGSTGAGGSTLAQESTPSPGFDLLSLANLSISRAEKSVTTSNSPSSPSSPSWSSISTCASRCSGVISTMGLNSMRAGRTPDTACAAVAKNSYWRYFNVCSAESRMSPLYSSRMYSHSKMCLSTSWNCILADSNDD